MRRDILILKFSLFSYDIYDLFSRFVSYALSQAATRLLAMNSFIDLDVFRDSFLVTS
jgi:hypothetical protein